MVDILATEHGPTVTIRAMEDGVEVGNASALLTSGGQVAYFTGGWVRESHRGRGIYRALLRWRIAHAKTHGAGLVVTQAVTRTSVPILRQLGFETLFASSRHALACRKGADRPDPEGTGPASA